MNRNSNESGKPSSSYRANLLKGSNPSTSAVDEAEKIVADYLSATPKNTKKKKKAHAPFFIGSAAFLIALALYLLVK